MILLLIGSGGVINDSWFFFVVHFNPNSITTHNWVERYILMVVYNVSFVVEVALLVVSSKPFARSMKNNRMMQ